MEGNKPARETWSGKVRQGRLDELEILAALEIDATGSLIEAGVTLAGPPVATPRHLMEQAHADGLLFVAADAADLPIGFLAGLELDDGLYIGEIDVWRCWQGRGIGRTLITEALSVASGRGWWGAMLTTDRFVPFNRPFYAKLGFVDVPQEFLPPGLAAILDDEIRAGLDPARRVGMLYRFADHARASVSCPDQSGAE